MEGAVWTACSDSEDATDQAADDCTGSMCTVNISEGKTTPDSEPQELKKRTTVGAEEQKPATWKDTGVSAKELKFVSPIAKNVVSQKLNPERAEEQRKKRNPIEAGRGQACKLVKKSEQPQKSQMHGASAECGKSSTFPSYSQWLQASQTSHLKTNPIGAKPLNSAESKETFSQSSQLAKHQAAQSGKVAYECTHCKITFKSASRLNRHRHRSHSTEASFRCPECNKSFPTPGSVSQHRRMIHNVEQPNQCSECNLILKNESCLNQHYRINHGPTICSECNMHFSPLAVMKQHQWEAHKIGKLLSCSHCSETFINFTKFKKHLKTHTYQCTECGQTFKKPARLHKHQKTHSQQML